MSSDFKRADKACAAQQSRPLLQGLAEQTAHALKRRTLQCAPVLNNLLLRRPAWQTQVCHAKWALQSSPHLAQRLCTRNCATSLELEVELDCQKACHGHAPVGGLSARHHSPPESPSGVFRVGGMHVGAGGRPLGGPMVTLVGGAAQTGSTQ